MNTGMAFGPFRQQAINSILAFNGRSLFRTLYHPAHRCPAPKCRCRMLLNGQIQPQDIGVRLNGGTADIAIQRKDLHMVHHAHRQNFTDFREFVIRHTVRPFQHNDLFRVNGDQLFRVAFSVPFDDRVAISLQPQQPLLLLEILE